MSSKITQLELQYILYGVNKSDKTGRNIYSLIKITNELKYFLVDSLSVIICIYKIDTPLCILTTDQKPCQNITQQKPLYS